MIGNDSLETGRKVAGIMKCDFGNLYAAMQFATIFGTTLASRHWGVTAQVTQARISSRMAHFVQPPDLVEATTFNSVQEWAQHTISRSTYPEGRRTPPAGNYYPAGGRRPHPLQTQRQPRLCRDAHRKGAHLTLGNSGAQDTDSLRDVDPPVTPGKMVTIGLPSSESQVFRCLPIWGHGVSSEKSHGQFVGFSPLLWRRSQTVWRSKGANMIQTVGYLPRLFPGKPKRTGCSAPNETLEIMSSLRLNHDESSRRHEVVTIRPRRRWLRR